MIFKLNPWRTRLNRTLARALTRTLAGTLALSIAASPFGTLARASQDPVDLLLESLTTDDPVQAKALLDQARASIRSERLPEDNQRRVDALLDQAAKKIEKRTHQSGPGGEPTGGGGPQPNKQKKSRYGFDLKGNEELQKLLSDNPDIRGSMWELGQGRLNRDAENVDNIVKNKTGRTPEEHDTIERQQIDELNQPGQLISALKKSGLIKSNYSAENRALREQFRGASLDTLADHIINRSLSSSVIAGLTKTILSEMTKSSGVSIKGISISGLGTFAGISAEAMATFIINANLTLQLADLYGIRLNSYEEEVAVLTVFAVAKIGVRYGLHSPEVRELGVKIGKGLATNLATGAKGGFAFLSGLLKHPVLATTLKRSNLNVTTDTNKAASTDSHPDFPSTTAHPDSEPQTRHRSGSGLSRVAAFGWYALKIAASTGWSVAETYSVGEISKLMFGSARQRERAIMNDLFRRYLMSPSGEGFFKLMVLSVNVGKANPPAAAASTSADPALQFTMNLARSARICSPDDMAKWAKVQSQKGNGGLSTEERRLVEYACDSNLSQSRYQRLAAELQTFNEIPQEYVAKLRIAGRENRLRMGELLLQMQFLDGDRDPAEVKYFEEVISKYLGFNSAEDLDYFEQLHSYIIEGGGMKSSPMSPTGYTIANDAKANPYDLSIGYTATAGPEAPPATAQNSSAGTDGASRDATSRVPPASSSSDPSRPTPGRGL